jgi:hypothetical protein
VTDKRTTIRGIIVGAIFQVAAFAITAMAMQTPDILMYYVSSFFPLAVWYVSIILGITVGISISGRYWPGMVVGVWSYLLFHGWQSIMQPADQRLAAFFSLGGLLGTLGSIVMPWAFGMLLGWASVHRRPVRHDGAIG